MYHMKTYPLPHIFSTVAGIATLLLVPHVGQPANATWSGNSSSDWVTGTNWVGDSAPGSISGNSGSDIATFNAASGNTSVTIDSGRVIGTLLFDMASVPSYTIGSTSAHVPLA